jgi:uncharacterized protein (TIGR03435 family)
MNMNHWIGLLLWSAASASAQQTFDVASIKPNAANDHRVMIRMMPGGAFSATGVTLKLLIGQAFNIRDFQIVGAPGWAGDLPFDINAKAEGLPDRVPPEQLRPMLQALIKERFQLKFHNEEKEMPVYALVVGKTGAKLTESQVGERAQMRMGRGQLSGKSIPMPMFAQQVAQQVGRTVLDRTGLKGSYDINLEWTPEPGHGPGGGPPPPPDAIPAAGGNGPTIFTALQEQLGLRLETQKGPVQMLVIDSVSKPSEN